MAKRRAVKTPAPRMTDREYNAALSRVMFGTVIIATDNTAAQAQCERDAAKFRVEVSRLERRALPRAEVVAAMAEWVRSG